MWTYLLMIVFVFIVYYWHKSRMQYLLPELMDQNLKGNGLILDNFINIKNLQVQNFNNLMD